MWIVAAVAVLTVVGVTLALRRRRSSPAIPATQRRQARVEPQL